MTSLPPKPKIKFLHWSPASTSSCSEPINTFNALKGVAFGLAAFGRAIVQTHLHAGFRSQVTSEIKTIPSYERVSSRPAYQKIIPATVERNRFLCLSTRRHRRCLRASYLCEVTYQYVIMIRTLDNTFNSNQRIAFGMAAPGDALIQTYFHSGI